LYETLQIKYLREWMLQSDGASALGVTQASFRNFVSEANLGIPDAKVDKIFNAIVEAKSAGAAQQGAASSSAGSMGAPETGSGRKEEATISLGECNNALRAYNSGGLWKDGVKDMIRLSFPTGPVKDMAMHNVDAAFDKFDQDKSGTIGPTEVGSLIRTLLTPGVEVSVFEDLVADSSMLGFSIPRRVIHELTDLVDANHDGYLQAEEFVSLLMAVVKQDVPGRVLARLGYTTSQIVKIVAYALLNLFFLFAMISLVISSFTSGAGLAQIVQTVSSGASIMYVKSQENSEFAKEEALMIKWAREKVIEELSAALNLSSQAVQDMKGKQGGDAPKSAKE
jgi:hypothetical protein